MSAGQHTPGPWEFRVYSNGCTIVSKHDRPGSSVRDALKGVSVIVEARIDDDQRNAREASPDARLIAAAPELLEALRWAMRYMEAANPTHTPAYRKHHEEARAAIAKATGAA